MSSAGAVSAVAPPRAKTPRKERDGHRRSKSSSSSTSADADVAPIPSKVPPIQSTPPAAKPRVTSDEDKACCFDPHKYPWDKPLDENKNFINRFTVHWLKPVIHYSRRRENFGVTDLYPVRKKYHAVNTLFRFQTKYEHASARGRGLLTACLHSLPGVFWLNMIPMAVHVAMGYVFPEILRLYLTHLAYLRYPQYMPPGEPVHGRNYGWWYVFAFGVIQLCQVIGDQLANVIALPCAVHLRISVTNFLYTRIIRMRESSRQRISSGNIANMLFGDSMRVQGAFQFIGYMLLLPAELAIGVWRVADVVGIACLGGFGALLVALIVIGVIGSQMMKRRVLVTKNADERVRRVTEILSGMRVVKLFGSEDLFHDRVGTARAYEIHQIRVFSVMQIAVMQVMQVMMQLMALVTFGVYVLNGDRLDSTLVYQTLSIYAVLRFPFIMMPMILILAQDMLVSMKRMSALVNMPSREDDLFVYRRSDGTPFDDWQKMMFRKEGVFKPTWGDGSRADTIGPQLLHGLAPGAAGAGVIAHDSLRDDDADDAEHDIQLGPNENPDALRPLGPPTEFAIEMAHPVCFTWATAQDRDIPAVFDTNFREKQRKAAEETKAHKKNISAYCKSNNVKQLDLWNRYSALLPEDVELTDRAKGPVGDKEFASFAKWVEQGCTENRELVPAPAVLKALLPVLYDVQCNVKRGQTVGIFGHVGSGKSSLLSALLGEMRVADPDYKYESYLQQQMSAASTASDFAGGRRGAVTEVGSPGAPREDGRVEAVRRPIGRLPEGSPAVVINGQIVYCPQSAWIMNATVRDNILFGAPWDEDWYNLVVSKCCLLADFEQFTAGDMTQVGDKGVTLSGGQKHRIALARAVYSRADIYLLDDPLSAVDAHVGRAIFDDVICGLLRDKTVLLVTHQTQYLPDVDFLVCLNQGEVEAMGTYEDIVAAGIQLEGLGKGAASKEGGEKRDGKHGRRGLRKRIRDHVRRHVGRDRKMHGDREGDDGGLRGDIYGAGEAMDEYEYEYEEADDSPPEVKEDGEADAVVADSGRLGGAETKETGAVSFRLLRDYVMLSGGRASFFVGLILQIMGDICLGMSDYTLSYWASHASARTLYVMAVYGGFTLVYFIFKIAGMAIWTFMCLRSAQNMHMEMIRAVLAAPMTFFDITPTGQILNRFAKDTDSADTLIPMYMMQFAGTLFGVLEMIGILAATNPWLLVPVAFVLIVTLIIFRRFRATARELRRLDAMTRSPVFVCTTETLDGVSSIRAYRREDYFCSLFFKRMDLNTGANFAFIHAPRWFIVRVDLVGVILVISCSIMGLYTYDQQTVYQLIGNALGYAVAIPMLMRELINSWVTLEAEFSSVERIMEYPKKLPQERPRHIIPNAGAIRSTWPERGEIEFSHVNLRYRPELPLVLKDMCIHINGGEKIGVVGRTGAGKTTITASLFQLVNVEPGSHIYLDGIDITRLGLHDIRRKIAIIPQDAFLFSGSLRSNMDPINFIVDEAIDRLKAGSKRPPKPEKVAKVRQRAMERAIRDLNRQPAKDEDIWLALERCRLRELFESKEDGLDFALKDNGKNLSAGERQLVCLAKALLLDAKVIVMDEATAQVDQASDRAVQGGIREVFADRTIICIAHRLRTIIDFDRILVMDAGKAKEFDTPRALLTDPTTIFSSLVAETGDKSAEFLRKIAFGEADLFTTLLASEVPSAVATAKHSIRDDDDDDELDA